MNIYMIINDCIGMWYGLLTTKPKPITNFVSEEILISITLLTHTNLFNKLGYSDMTMENEQIHNITFNSLVVWS